MRLLSASSLGSTGKEAVPLQTAWTGYQQVLKGRFHHGTTQLRQAATAAEAFPRAHASCLGLGGLAARLACHWDDADRMLLAAAKEFGAAHDPLRSGLTLALHVEALAARGELERAQANIKDVARDFQPNHLSTELATASLRIAQGKRSEAEELVGVALQRAESDFEPGDGTEFIWWARSFRAELLCDQRRYDDAESELAQILTELLRSRNHDEILVRVLCQLLQARLGAAWQNPQRRTAVWTAEIKATLAKARLVAAGFPRYRARHKSFEASATALFEGRSREELHESQSALESLALNLERSRLAEEYAAVSAEPLHNLVEHAQNEYALVGAQARVEALAAPAQDGVRPTLMLSRTQLTAQVSPGQDLEMDAIFAVNRAISSVLTVRDLMNKILQEVSRVLKAERAAIIRRVDGEIACVASHNLDPRMVRPQSQEISFTVVEKVLAERKTVLTDNAQSDDRFRGQASVMATEIRSVLCAPLQTKNNNYGCIYLDSTLRTGLFKPIHRELIKVFATQAATALENAEAFERLDSLNATLESRVAQRTEELQATNQELETALTEVREIQLKLVQAEKEALEKEMAVARDIQQTLVPDETVFELGVTRVAGVVRPASFVGGDIWIYKKISERRFLVLVGDATGHGVGPGMVTTAMKACVDALVRPGSTIDLPDLFDSMHDAVFQSAAGKIRLSAFGCIIDTETGVEQCVSASHPPPMVIRDPNGLAQVEALNGPLSSGIGVEGVAKYESFRPKIPAGSRLVLLTDGILEAENDKGRPFGARRFGKAAVLGARRPVDQHRDTILAAGDEYRGSVPLDDDVTVVVIQLP